MAFGKSFQPNPISKGHEIERRRFYSRDDDFRRMCQVVPFEPGAEPKASAWWANTIDNRSILLTGVPGKKQHIIAAPISSDRQMYPGDTPDTLIEGRIYSNATFKNQMLRVCTPNRIPGVACMSWWEVENPESPSEGWAELCTGLVATKDAPVAGNGDGLEGDTKAVLLRKAGVLNLRDVNESMQEGEIIQRIREKQASKTKKTKEPVTV